MRERAYTAVLRDDRILMVRHVHDGRDYWTLPGGHIKSGESPEQAARRELLEETGVPLLEIRELFRDEDGVCFLGVCEPDAEATLGSDPDLEAASQWLIDVKWFRRH